MDYQTGQVRLFTAIPLPEDIKTLATEIFRGRLPVSYVNTTNLHITLNFFGELDSERTDVVKNIFSRICQGKTSFDVLFDKIVAHHNRQIHLTLADNPSLEALQKDLEAAFESAGFHFQNREFYPHVKLANMHLDNVMNRERKIANFPNEELSRLNFRASKIVLFESKLLLHHSHYSPLMETPLL